MTNDAVRYSRAGDRFHYLWAARQCLELIDLRSPVQAITVECSPEANVPGELVIDVGKVRAAPDGTKTVHYYQLKHSTVRRSKAIALSELAATLKGFAARFRHRDSQFSQTAFSIVSNRPVEAGLKKAVAALACGRKPLARITTALKKHTKLSGAELERFCAALSFQDDEGDYLQQERELQYEMAAYATTGEDTEVLKLVGLVLQHALPSPEQGRERGTIVREDVLKRLGVGHPRDLFPAPLAMESIAGAFLREQHRELVREISAATCPVILHAPGGVGKSVVAQQLARSFSKGSVGVVYDCFGGGAYLNPALPRHRACDALVQIANELSVQGLCRTLLANAATPRDFVLRNFSDRIAEACSILQKRSKKALLVLLIDAADNAEMAAEAANDAGFARALVRQSYPANCRLVFLCRTERRKHLDPPANAVQIPLKPFSLAETSRHLKSRFLKSSSADAVEFHRLTGGNPRVQANCLSFSQGSVREMLSALGPGRTTVDKQISQQLGVAIANLRERHVGIAAAQIDSICRGLATLPPFIPIPVLAAAAMVDEDAIKSFISDLGRPLWHSDNAVQFRDEPVETWFRESYAASKEEIRRYAETLEPQASRFTYISRALPGLWHRAGDHDRLIAIALSDKFLPDDSPIDVRDVRVYRLQFAFKTALAAGRLCDAAKVALRAGEEMAGNQRQLALMKLNTDLMGSLQEPHLVQECAYKRVLKGGWTGSENAFSASLLSAFRDFHGEARNYLDAAFRWLALHFEERASLQKTDPHHKDSLNETDIAELAWAELHLFGAKAATAAICRWKPPTVVFVVARIVVGQLVDAGRFKEINNMARHGHKNAYFTLGLVDALARVGKFPAKATLSVTLKQLVQGKVEFHRHGPDSLRDEDTPAIVSFAEACAHHKLSPARVCSILANAADMPRLHWITSDYDETRRHTLARAIALRCVLKDVSAPDVDQLVPDAKDGQRDDHHSAEERHDARRVLGALVPLYCARAQVIAKVTGWESVDFTTIKVDPKYLGSSYSGHSRIDGFWDELPLVRISILALKGTAAISEIGDLKKTADDRASHWRKFSIACRMARLAYRHEHLFELGQAFEQCCVALIEAEKSETPDDRAGRFIGLARAVFTSSREDASAYFSHAIESVSKFGDEILERWDAVAAIARRCGDTQADLSELTYRFVRSAELIGNAAEEKHWDRSDVFRIAVRMHAPSAFAALSRWRDRDVGYFHDELEAIAISAVQESLVDHTAGFCLSGFDGPDASTALLKECLRREPAIPNRQKMFDVFVDGAYRDSGLIRSERHFVEIAQNFGVATRHLRQLLKAARRLQPAVVHEPKESSYVATQRDDGADPIAQALHGLNLSSASGLATAVSMLDANRPRWYSGSFWSVVVSKVRHGREVEFLKTVVAVKQTNYLDLRAVLAAVRDKWMEKASVRRHWPSLLRSIGKRFHLELANRWSLHYWRQERGLTEEDADHITHGIQEGIASAPALLHSGTLFGFVFMVAKRLTVDEARQVLDFALQRFQDYIEPEYADGTWQPWLHPPSTNSAALTGLIWAALGAPDSRIRWEAAHCVRRMVEFGCTFELADLLGWPKRGGIEAFLGRGYPFYPLHAQLYLLIGLHRGALSSAAILAPHLPIFTEMALHTTPHALIQPAAARLALAIAEAVPGSATSELSSALRTVGASPFAIRDMERDERVDTPFHAQGLVVPNNAPGPGMDFDAYWLPDLADVFGVPTKQLDDLCRVAAAHDVGVSISENGYPSDPRRDLWNSRRYDSGGTSHSHGSYPRVDTYHFYYEYHSLMIAAARLLTSMPVIRRSRDGDDDGNRWCEWIMRHGLTRQDGGWLSDRRDPTLPSRKKLSGGSRAEWLCGVTADDFLHVLTAQPSVERGLCVSGSWSDGEYARDESISISSALVRPQMANALANALRTAEGPSLKDETADKDVEEPPFDLLQWIEPPPEPRSGLDQFDPHANGLSYPVRKVSDRISRECGLSTDSENRRWWRDNRSSPVVVSEAWSEPESHGRYSRRRYGQRMFATVDFLKELCKQYDRVLIVLVQIHRYEEHESSYRDDLLSWLPWSNKAFILTRDGLLRDATKDHQLR